jgi:hypothetical protein
MDIRIEKDRHEKPDRSPVNAPQRKRQFDPIARPCGDSKEESRDTMQFKKNSIWGFAGAALESQLARR